MEPSSSVKMVELNKAVDFILTADHIKREDKPKLKSMVEFVNAHSLKHGLSEKNIFRLATLVVTSSSYDGYVKRKVLFSLIPEKPGIFPYEIIPQIIGTFYPKVLYKSFVGVLWVKSVLSWLVALLEHRIINSGNSYLRLNYTYIFNMLSISRLTRSCCQLLVLITIQTDVIPLRVETLMSLYKKFSYASSVDALMRLYSTMRPDLCVLMGVQHSRRALRTPIALETGMTACSRRTMNEEDDELTDLWGFGTLRVQRVDPLSRRTVIPAPKVMKYSATLEEKQKININVLQCTKFSQLVQAIKRHKDWMWPNSVSSLIRKPLLILAFRPHEVNTMLCLDSWFDATLRSEILHQNNTGLSQQRASELLQTVTKFVEVQILTGGVCSPVIVQFVMSYLLLWDQQQHLATVLRLVKCLGCVSSFSSIVLSRLLPILATRRLSICCAVVNTLRDTMVNWCHHFHNNRNVQEGDVISLLEGVMEVSRLLDGPFLACLMKHNCSLMLSTAVLDYFTSITQACELLSLPIHVCPSPALSALIMSCNNQVLNHRMGLLLSGLIGNCDRVVRFCDELRYFNLCEEVMKEMEMNNKVIQLYVAYCYDLQPLTEDDNAWYQMSVTFNLSPVLGRLNSLKTVNCIGSALGTLSLSHLYLKQKTDDNNNGDSSDEVLLTIRDYLLDHLEEASLTGIRKCVQVNSVDSD